MARCLVRQSATAAGARVTASRSTATARPMNVHDVSIVSPMEAPYCALMLSANPATPIAAIASIAAPTGRGMAMGWRGFARGGDEGGEGGGEGGDAADGALANSSCRSTSAAGGCHPFASRLRTVLRGSLSSRAKAEMDFTGALVFGRFSWMTLPFI